MKKVEEFQDLELAEAINQTWSQLLTMQNQLQLIQGEITNRKSKPKEDKQK